MLRFMPVVYFTVFFAGFFAWIGLGWLLGTARHPLAKWLARMCYLVASTWVLELIAEIYGFDGPKPHYTTGFAWFWWTARALKAIAPVMVGMWILQSPAKHEAEYEAEAEAED